MKKKNGLISQIRDELITFFENVIAPYMDKEFGEVNGKLDKVENRLDKVENRLDGVEDELHGVKNELVWVKNDVRDLKANTPKPLPAFA